MYFWILVFSQTHATLTHISLSVADIRCIFIFAYELDAYMYERECIINLSYQNNLESPNHDVLIYTYYLQVWWSLNTGQTPIQIYKFIINYEGNTRKWKINNFLKNATHIKKYMHL